MEYDAKTFPTGNKDLDLLLLSQIKDDGDLLNTLSLATKNKLVYTNEQLEHIKKCYEEDRIIIKEKLDNSLQFYLRKVFD